MDLLGGAQIVIGHLEGDKQSYEIAQVKHKVLRFKKLVIGDLEIQNLHVRVISGYPENSVSAINADLKTSNGRFTISGRILGLAHNRPESKVELNIIKARLIYALLPWLNVFAGLGTGMKWDEDTVVTLEPKIGLEVSGRLGPFELNGFAEGLQKVTEERTYASCGAVLGLNLIDEKFFAMSAEVLSQLNLETNAGSGNTVENINVLGVSGRF